MAYSNEPKELTEEQLDELRQLLLTKRQEVIKSIDLMRVRDFESNPDDNMEEIDQASTNQMQTVQLRVLEKEYKLLREVNRALEKFNTGDYGLCEGTEEPIGYPRLKVRPWARYSIDYAEEKERMDRQASSRLPGR
ncbi:MAG: TraR/DksA C4-type zinc finger protein [Syntrophotaleaceae bacterium]